MNRIKIYVLHYRCGGEGELVSCYNKACDLCSMHHELYYDEVYVTKDELFNILNIPETDGSYIHISNVLPKGWISKKEYYGFE